MNNDYLVFFFTKITSEISFAILVLIILHILIMQGRRKEASFVFISSLHTLAIVWILKNLFKIERPENSIIKVDGYAFPSGHAALSIFLGYITYILFVKKLENKYKYPITLGIIMLVISVGLSRLYFGVHTPIQVLAGYFIGIITPILIKKFSNKI